MWWMGLLARSNPSRYGANDFSFRCVARHVLVCLPDLLPREDLVHKDRQLAALEVRQNRAQLIPQLLLVVGGSTPQRGALHPNALDQERADVGVGHFGATHQAKNDN